MINFCLEDKNIQLQLKRKAKQLQHKVPCVTSKGKEWEKAKKGPKQLAHNIM